MINHIATSSEKLQTSDVQFLMQFLFYFGEIKVEITMLVCDWSTALSDLIVANEKWIMVLNS